MIANKTYNNVINTLKNIGDQHDQIATVTTGDIFDINLEKMEKFALMHINPVNVTTGDFGLTWQSGIADETRYVDIGTAQQYGGGVAGSGLDVSGLMKMALANRGRGKLYDIYNQNWLRNKEMMDEAYRRSLPKGVRGPAGVIEWDDETEEMLMEFSPEMQKLYEGWLRAEQRAGEELGAYDMDERTLKQIGMFDEASVDMDRRNQQRADELAFSQGLGGTQQYYRNLSLGEQVNQRRLQEALKSREMAMGERNLLRAEQLAFGNSAIDSQRMLMTQAELARMIGAGAHTGVNAAGASMASMALADTQAGFWSGLMGGASQYGGYGAPKAGATTTTAAAGNTDRYSSSPMMGGGDWLSQILSQIV